MPSLVNQLIMIVLLVGLWGGILLFPVLLVTDKLLGMDLKWRIPGWFMRRWTSRSKYTRYAVVGAFGALLLADGSVLAALLVGAYLLARHYGVFGRLMARAQVTAIKRRGGSGDYVLPMNIHKGLDTNLLRELIPSAVSVETPTSVLALGTTGSGKTEVGKTLAYQMAGDSRADEPTVIYDHKDDYQEFFNVATNREIIRITPEESAHTWNLFREVEREGDYDEIARSLFPVGDDGDSFFDKAARQVFAAACIALEREHGRDSLSNEALVSLFESTSRDDMHDVFEENNLQAAATALDPDAGRQASGVYATVQQKVSEIFIDDFASSGEFSVREYMANPAGRVLVFDYPQRRGKSVRPVFRFLIDHAAELSLDDKDRGGTFILDEFARVPYLKRVDELLNVGRGQGVQVLLTLQSVAQLYDNYGKSAGKSMLAGLVNRVILRLGDDESVDYARSVIGTEFTEYTAHESSGGEFGSGRRETKEEEEHHFAKGEFVKWDPGHGVFIDTSTWMYGYFPMLNPALARIIDEAHGRQAASDTPDLEAPGAAAGDPRPDAEAEPRRPADD